MAGIEEKICDAVLPTNSTAVAQRIEKLLQESNTNSLEFARHDDRMKKAMWLLNSQFYGETATIDMNKEWEKLCRKVV